MRNLILTILFCFASLSYGADITVEKSTTSVGRSAERIYLRGAITSGDFQKLVSVLVSGDIYYKTIILDSPGGNVEESIRIAGLIRELRISTRVPEGGTCASACFFIWLEGSKRFASGSGKVFGRLGLHRPYLTAPTNDSGSVNRQNKVVSEIRSYLEQRHLSRRLIDIMMGRASNEVYWATSDDLNQELKLINPDLEELYISKCGNSTNRLVALRRTTQYQEDKQYSESVDKKIDDIWRCEEILDIAVRKIGYEKLEKQWYPNGLPSTSNATKANEENAVEAAHPGWIKIVRSPEFTSWLEKQDSALKKLAASDSAADAIKLLSIFKNSK